MIKAIGAVVLIASAFGYGFIKIRDERRKITYTQELADFVRFIRDNISHYMKPLPEIFSAYESGRQEISRFAENCVQDGIKIAWNDTEFELTDDARRVMSDFANSLGGGYREDELNLCDYTLEQLTNIHEKMRQELEGKEKMYRTIPPLLALSVVLIFI